MPFQHSAATQWRDRSKLVRDVGFAVVAIVAVAGASAVGQIATYPNLAPWYSGLSKPTFNPPNWVFAPVWTTFYVLMALAMWRILRLQHARRGRSMALIFFFVQLTLNTAWSWMSFGANSPVLGLINIVPQLLVILATISLFHRLDRIAAWCLVPLAARVAFASVLNVSIWWLNV
jgi:tryptophan-rich sensory protein